MSLFDRTAASIQGEAEDTGGEGRVADLERKLAALNAPRAEEADTGKPSNFAGQFVAGAKDTARDIAKGLSLVVGEKGGAQEEFDKWANKALKDKGYSLPKSFDKNNVGEFFDNVSMMESLQSDPALLEDPTFLEKVVRATPQVIGQAVASVATGGTLSMSMMGVQILGSSYQNSINEGATHENAKNMAMLNAVIQAPIEQIGIGKATKWFKPKMRLVKRIKEIGQSAAVEGLTEFIQQYPDAWTNLMAKNPDENKLKQLAKVIASPEVFAEAKESGAIGAILGGGISTAGVAVNARRTGESVENTPEMAANLEAVEEVKAEQVQKVGKFSKDELKEELKTRGVTDSFLKVLDKKDMASILVDKMPKDKFQAELKKKGVPDSFLRMMDERDQQTQQTIEPTQESTEVQGPQEPQPVPSDYQVTQDGMAIPLAQTRELAVSPTAEQPLPVSREGVPVNPAVAEQFAKPLPQITPEMQRQIDTGSVEQTRLPEETPAPASEPEEGKTKLQIDVEDLLSSGEYTPRQYKAALAAAKHSEQLDKDIEKELNTYLEEAPAKVKEPQETKKEATPDIAEDKVAEARKKVEEAKQKAKEAREKKTEPTIDKAKEAKIKEARQKVEEAKKKAEAARTKKIEKPKRVVKTETGKIVTPKVTEKKVTPTPKNKAKPTQEVSSKDVEKAYKKTIEQNLIKSSSVEISALQKNLGMPMEEFKEYLREESREGRVTLSTGSWDVANDEERSGAIEIRGVKHLIAKINEFRPDAEPKAKRVVKAETGKMVTPKVTSKALAPEKVKKAYQKVVDASNMRGSNVEISEVHKHLDIPMEEFKEYLKEESREGRVNLSLGDWSVSNEEMRKGAVEIYGRPHILVKFKEFRPEEKKPSPKKRLPKAKREAKIKEASLKLAEGQYEKRVHLKDIRKEVPDVSREDFDNDMLRMQNEGELVLMNLNDPRERTPEDKEAAIDILGKKRHIVYMKEPKPKKKTRVVKAETGKIVTPKVTEKKRTKVVTAPAEKPTKVRKKLPLTATKGHPKFIEDINDLTPKQAKNELTVLKGLVTNPDVTESIEDRYRMLVDREAGRTAKQDVTGRTEVVASKEEREEILLQAVKSGKFTEEQRAKIDAVAFDKTGKPKKNIMNIAKKLATRDVQPDELFNEAYLRAQYQMVTGSQNITSTHLGGYMKQFLEEDQAVTIPKSETRKGVGKAVRGLTEQEMTESKEGLVLKTNGGKHQVKNEALSDQEVEKKKKIPVKKRKKKTPTIARKKAGKTEIIEESLLDHTNKTTEKMTKLGVPEKTQKIVQDMVETDHPQTPIKEEVNAIEKAIGPLKNERGEVSFDLEPAVKALSKKKSKLAKIFDVESWFEVGEKDLALSVKNHKGHQATEQMYALRDAQAVEDVVQKQEPDMSREDQTEALLAYENKELVYAKLSDEKKKLYDPIIQQLDGYFRGMQKELKSIGQDLDYVKNSLKELQKEHDGAETQKERDSIKEEMAVLRQMRFASIPVGLLYTKISRKARHGSGKGKKKAKAMIKFFNEMSVERKVLSIDQLLKHKLFKGITLTPTEVVGMYGNRAAKDFALARVVGEMAKAGLIVKKGKNKKAPAPSGFRKASVFKWPALSDYFVSDRGMDVLENLVKLETTTNPYDYLNSRVKALQFFNPIFMPMYDVLQGVKSGQWRLSSIGDFKAAIADVRHKSDEFLELQELGGFSKPFELFSDEYIMQLTKIGARGRIPGISSIVEAAQIRGKSKPGMVYHGAEQMIMGASWNAAWQMDNMIRMVTYKGLVRRGMSKSDAAQMTAKIHGDYASVPAKTRKWLNRFIFTPTFKIVMHKMYYESIKSSLSLATKTMTGNLGKASNVEKAMALNAMTIAATGAAFHMVMKSLGFGLEDDDWFNYGRSYVHKDMKKLRIVLSTPHNIDLRYLGKMAKAHRSTYGDVFSVDFVERVFGSDSAILPKIAMSMYTNRTFDGSPIYDELDSRSMKRIKSISYGLLQSAAIVNTAYRALRVATGVKSMSMRSSYALKRDAEIQKLFKGWTAIIETLSPVYFGYKTPEEQKLFKQIQRNLNNYVKDMKKSAMQNRGVNNAWTKEFERRNKLLMERLDNVSK